MRCLTNWWQANDALFLVVGGPSTYSGYINRLSVYHSVKIKQKGYELGHLQSYYFLPEEKKNQMIQYYPVKVPLYMREFPVGWRDIDKGIGELSSIK